MLIKDTTGKPLFFQGIITDITELKLATEKIYLFQSLAMAISVSRNLHDALVVAIQKICNYTGWIYGEAWMPNQDGRVWNAIMRFTAALMVWKNSVNTPAGLPSLPAADCPVVYGQKNSPSG